MTVGNTYQHPQKGAECRECKRAYMKVYMRERRARERREASRRSKRKAR